MGKAAASTGPNAEGRVVVYIAGAISYSEVRVAYEVSQETGWDIIVGSGAVTPQQFLSAMQTLSEEPTAVSAASTPSQQQASHLTVASSADAGGASRPADGTLTFVKGSGYNQ